MALAEVLELSTFFVTSIFFIILAGILIGQFFKREFSRREIFYLLAILIGAVIYTVSGILLLSISDFAMNAIAVIYALIYFFVFLSISLRLKRLNKSLVFFILFFFSLSLLINVLALFNLGDDSASRIVHSAVLLGFSLSVNFLLIKFLAHCPICQPRRK